MEYTEVLRRLSINDNHFAEHFVIGVEPVKLDRKTLALVRVAALIAVGGAVPSYGAEAAAALSAGATLADIVEVLLGVLSIVGLPSAVVAATALAMALACDIDNGLERPAGG